MHPDDILLARQRLDLTQAGLAVLLGINRVTLANWESGKHPAPPFLRLALAALEAGIGRE